MKTAILPFNNLYLKRFLPLILILKNKSDGMWKEVFFVSICKPKYLFEVKIPKDYINYLIYTIKAKSREKSLAIVYLCLGSFKEVLQWILSDGKCLKLIIIVCDFCSLNNWNLNHRFGMYTYEVNIFLKWKLIGFVATGRCHAFELLVIVRFPHYFVFPSRVLVSQGKGENVRYLVRI